MVALLNWLLLVVRSGFKSGARLQAENIVLRQQLIVLSRKSGVPVPREDRALLKAIARAHQWSDALLSGRARSVEEIADRERVGARYVRRLTRLAFLAPKIVEMIAAGRQPPELTAEALAERIDLPLLWAAQEEAVGV